MIRMPAWHCEKGPAALRRSRDRTVSINAAAGRAEHRPAICALRISRQMASYVPNFESGPSAREDDFKPPPPMPSTTAMVMVVVVVNSQNLQNAAPEIETRKSVRTNR